MIVAVATPARHLLAELWQDHWPLLTHHQLSILKVIAMSGCIHGHGSTFREKKANFFLQKKKKKKISILKLFFKIYMFYLFVELIFKIYTCFTYLW
jgi:hypothetical protein